MSSKEPWIQSIDGLSSSGPAIASVDHHCSVWQQSVFGRNYGERIAYTEEIQIPALLTMHAQLQVAVDGSGRGHLFLLFHVISAESTHLLFCKNKAFKVGPSSPFQRTSERQKKTAWSSKLDSELREAFRHVAQPLLKHGD